MLFGVKFDKALMLMRIKLYCHWTETFKSGEEGEEPQYFYQKQWRRSLEDSNQFKDPLRAAGSQQTRKGAQDEGSAVQTVAARAW